MIRFLAILLTCLSAQAAFFDNFDIEAYRWRRFVATASTNTSTVSGRAYNAATRFMQASKQHGYRTNLVHVGLYLGSDLTAVRIPIIADIVNTDGPIRNDNFVPADYVESGVGAGLTGDGTTKNLVLSRVGTVSMSQIGQRAHLGVYVQTGGDAAQTVIGATEVAGDSSAYLLVSYTGGLTYAQMNDNVALQWNVADSGGIGLYICTRTSATFAAVYKNGLQLSTQTGTVVGTHNASFPIAVHCQDSNGSFISQTTKTLSFWTVGYELTPNVQAAYQRAIQRVQHDMFRAK